MADLIFNNFTGLWIPSGEEIEIPPGALLVADNIDYFSSPGDDGGNLRIRGRRGRAKYNATALPGTGNVLMLHRHYPRTGSPATVVAFQNGANVNFRHDTIGDGTFASVTGDFNAATGKRWHALVWPEKNASFLVNGVDGMRAYNGVLSAVTQTGVVANGPYLTLWKNRMWLTKPDELSHSVYGTDINNEANVTATNHLSLNDPQGGSINGLTASADGQFLLAFKQTSGWNFNGDVTLGEGLLFQYTDEGLVAPETLDRLPEGVVYLTRHGLVLSNGLDARGIDLSLQLKPLFVSADSQTVYPNAVGKWFPRQQRYLLSLDPANSNTVYALHRIELRSLSTGSRSGTLYCWSKYTGVPFLSACSWSSETDDGRMLAGATNGQVWTLDTGTTDDGVAVTSLARTAARMVGEPPRVGNVRYVKSFHKSKTPLTVGLRYDGATSDDVSVSLGATLGSADLQRARKRIEPASKSGQFVQVSVSSTESHQFELYQLRLDIQRRALKVWR